MVIDSDKKSKIEFEYFEFVVAYYYRLYETFTKIEIDHNGKMT